MAKKQTRRSISLSRETYEAAAKAAARDGVATSEWVTRLIQAACPDLGPQRHASAPQPVVVHVPNATPEPPRHVPTPRHVLDRIAAERKLAVNGVRPGAFCRNCIDRPATHVGRIDLTGVTYELCDACELPAVEKRGPERGYEPNGGLPTEKETRAAARHVVGEERWDRETRDVLQMQRAPTPPSAQRPDSLYDAMATVSAKRARIARKA